MSEWVSVKDRLPEEYSEVLVHLEDGRIGVGSWFDCGDYMRFRFNGTSNAMKYWGVKPTHWMPLSGPPNA